MAFRNNRHQVTLDIIDHVIGIEKVVLSAVTKMELMVGALNKVDSQNISRKLERFNHVLLNEEISFKAIELIQKYSLSHGLAISDSLIAATAMVVKLPLFTYNVRDYKFISGLDLFNPNA